MRTLLLVLCLGMLLGSSLLMAEETYLEVKVMDPYIELHTGPGVGYPVFHVVDRDELIEVLKRKTDWFKVRASNGKTGWADRAQMELTLMPSGDQTRFTEVSLGDFSSRRWEVGLVGGQFNDLPVMTLYGANALTANLAAELSVSQVLGDYSSSWISNFNLLLQPFPRWRYSPFFTLGVGHIETRTKATLVQAKDSSDEMAHVGVGLKTYLTRRFILRVDYKNYIGFSSDDDNEGFEEWKAGFAFFF